MVYYEKTELDLFNLKKGLDTLIECYYDLTKSREIMDIVSDFINDVKYFIDALEKVLTDD